MVDLLVSRLTALAMALLVALWGVCHGVVMLVARVRAVAKRRPATPSMGRSTERPAV